MRMAMELPMSWPAQRASPMVACCSRRGSACLARCSPASTRGLILPDQTPPSARMWGIDIVALKRNSSVGIEYLNRVRQQPPARRRSFAVESLESRVLPSGVSPFPVKKASFLDGDGDKVKVKMKSDLFVISLLGGAENNADIDTITILPGKLGIFDPKADLTIKVKHGKTGDGITEIAHINLEDHPQLTERFDKMELTNVVLDNMNLFGDLTTLSAKNTDFGNVEIGGALLSMVIGNHDLTGTISAHSIGPILNTGPLSAGDIAGNVISETTIAKTLTNPTSG